MPFELLDHTADVGIHAWSETLDGLFAEAGRALVSVMGTPGDGPHQTVDLAIDAPDEGALMVDWLSELLYLFEVRGMVPASFDVHVVSGEWRIAGRVSGPSMETFVQEGPAVKAATYHLLDVSNTGDRWETTVYLDI